MHRLRVGRVPEPRPVDDLSPGPLPRGPRTRETPYRRPRPSILENAAHEEGTRSARRARPRMDRDTRSTHRRSRRRRPLSVRDRTRSLQQRPRANGCRTPTVQHPELAFRFGRAPLPPKRKPMTDVLLLGSDAPELAPLAGALRAHVATVALSDVSGCDWDEGVARLEAGFAAIAPDASYPAVVTAMWPTQCAIAGLLVHAPATIWSDGELALAAWFGCLQIAV